MASSVEYITVMSSDGDEFQMTVSAALKSGLLKRMLEDDCISGKLPLQNVNSETLVKVMEYCQKHADHEATKVDLGASEEVEGTELKTWDAEFVKVDVDLLHDVIMAAHYMEIQDLFDLICQTVADMITGRTPAQIRKTFRLKNDLTPAQEEEFRSKQPWCFLDMF